MKYLLLIIIPLFCFGKSFATVGGPQELTTIGYTDSAVFFTKEYFDESARGAQLWIYNISTGLITVDDSWSFEETYRDTENIVKDMRAKYSINKMKKAFDEYSYNVNDIDIIALETIQKFDKYNEVYYESTRFVLKYNYYVISLEVCDSGKPKIQHHFTINDNHFAIVRYTGLCYETGYKTDTLFAFTDQFIPHSIQLDETIFTDSISISDSSSIDQQEDEPKTKEKTYWKRGEPNYLFIILPVVLIIVVVIVLKWKKKDS